jgi:hypothetical protein
MRASLRALAAAALASLGACAYSDGYAGGYGGAYVAQPYSYGYGAPYVARPYAYGGYSGGLWRAPIATTAGHTRTARRPATPIGRVRTGRAMAAGAAVRCRTATAPRRWTPPRRARRR